ncbi:Ras GTPase [Reticulomyxa filosa]|uniref:small monomeric GTPase n=1 Tax=Reticulomyxa filosa TaxID=46433 RepID=X6M6Q3_RETFI|nr:Ras GTPase [Reticulomyxa filosa]|eukprot:ETO09594.1 Ras GTPase [Reticulomyxa filosa]
MPKKIQTQNLKTKGIKQGLAFIIVYSIDSDLSFKGAQDIYSKIQLIKDDKEYHVVLFANKLDLGDARREVQTQQGKDLAKSWNVPFFEGSALTSTNIIEAFETIVRSCRNGKQGQNTSNNSGKDAGSGCCLIL